MTSRQTGPELLAHDPWASELGMEVVESGPESTKVRMPLTGKHMNFLDGAHGGVLFSLAQSAMGVAARRDGGTEVRLVDAHLALTAGGDEGDVFTAEVTPVNVGRTLGVYRVAVSRGDGRTVGEFTGTVAFG